MKVITAFSVNEALPQAIFSVLAEGYDEESRNGPAKVFPTAVTTVYLEPRCRVLFCPERDANPFFHLVESFWMLSGSKKIGLPAWMAANMKNFSVDGETFHAAYGDRWRFHFGLDQLSALVEKLRAVPNTRQAVLQIWDAGVDLIDTAENKADRACNISCVFTPRPNPNGAPFLDMTVSNRSNDMVWGAYGANAVHFSFLLSFIAESAGMEVGFYNQVSANHHMYGEGLYGKKLDQNLIQPFRDYLSGAMSQKEGEPLPRILQLNQTAAGSISGRFQPKEGDLTPVAEQNSYFEENVALVANVFGKDMIASFNDFVLFGDDGSLLPLILDSGVVVEEKVQRILDTPCRLPFVKLVVLPMLAVYVLYKETKNKEAASALLGESNLRAFSDPELLSQMRAQNFSDAGDAAPVVLDWFLAGQEWLDRRP